MQNDVIEVITLLAVGACLVFSAYLSMIRFAFSSLKLVTVALSIIRVVTN